MGICESDLNDMPSRPPKQPQIDAIQFLHELPDGWVTACGKESMSIVTTPGKIWGYWTDWPPQNLPTYYYAIKVDLGESRQNPPMAWFPKDGSYGSENVQQGRISALAQVYGQADRINNTDTHCHDAVSSLAGQTRFYDYDFNIVDREERTEQTFYLEAKREVCGLVFMEAPLKYVPIGKNYMETEGPNKPYLMFAVPKHVIMSVNVDGSKIEFCDSPVPGKKCFMCWDLSSNSGMDKCRYFNLFLLARKNKASKWSGPLEYPKRCAEAFARLFSELKPGWHKIDMTFQFAYTTKKVGMLCNESTETLANHGASVYGGPPMVERLLFRNTKTEDSESVILKPNDPNKMMISEIFSTGALTVAVPEKRVFDDVMKAFYGFEEQVAENQESQKLDV